MLRKIGLGFLFAIAAVAIAIAQTAPPNCNTAGGQPCSKTSWNVASCSSTVTHNGPNGAQDGGPCTIAILRCTGSATTCTTASLPPQNGAAGNPPAGNALWKVLTSSLAQTTTAGGPYFDNVGLAYNTTYFYTVIAEYSGAGGGVWSAYPATFSSVVFGAAPTPPLGFTATPDTVTTVTQ